MEFGETAFGAGLDHAVLWHCPCWPLHSTSPTSDESRNRHRLTWSAFGSDLIVHRAWLEGDAHTTSTTKNRWCTPPFWAWAWDWQLPKQARFASKTGVLVSMTGAGGLQGAAFCSWQCFQWWPSGLPCRWSLNFIRKFPRKRVCFRPRAISAGQRRVHDGLGVVLSRLSPFGIARYWGAIPAILLKPIPSCSCTKPSQNSRWQPPLAVRFCSVSSACEQDASGQRLFFTGS